MDVTTTVDVEWVLVMVIPLFGLSFYYAAVVTMATLVSAIMAVAVVTIAAYGSSFFFSSAVADVVEMVSAN